MKKIFRLFLKVLVMFGLLGKSGPGIMGTCTGNNYTCNSTLYKCQKCGSVGCSSPSCTNRSFKLDECMRCGSSEVKSV